MIKPFIFGVSEIAEHAHHGHSHAIDPMNPLALWVALAAIVSKEALFHITMRIAKKVNSDVLAANAWHHRTDAASSFVALVALGGAVWGMPFLDPVGGIIVAGEWSQ